MVAAAGLLLASAAPDAAAQSVLRTARGLASDDVTVLVNRAVVVESAQPFVEVSVAQPEIADVSPLSDRAIYIFGRARGTTTLTLLGENGGLIANVEIRVTTDLSELKERLAQVLPDEPIDVYEAGGSVVLSGVVSGKAKLDRALVLARNYTGGNVTNMMSVGGTQQVALKVRIAEMSRSASKALGVSTEFVFGDDGAIGLGRSGGIDVDLTGETTTAFTVPAESFGAIGTIFEIADTVLASIIIDAAEDKGFARTLSEPTLIALSGTEASFLAGGEVPIPVVSEDEGTDVEFREIGVSLSFIPTVLDNDELSIALSTAVTTIADPAFVQAAGISLPSFNTQRAETTINLRDGESFAIAGLYENSFNDAVGQLPWVGDLPVVGNLFRSVNFQKNESELVVIVTANLVAPVGDIDSFALPGSNVAIPNEAELFLFGQTEVPGDGAFSQGFDGSYGYVVE